VSATQFFDDKGRIITIAAFQNISQRKAEAERIQFTKSLHLKCCSAAGKRCISRVQPHLGTKVKERTPELSQTLEILKATLKPN